MGLSETAYYGSWIFYSITVLSIIATLNALILSNLFKNSSIISLYTWMICFMLYLLGKSIFISSLTSDPLIAIILGVLSYFIEDIAYIIEWA